MIALEAEGEAGDLALESGDRGGHAGDELQKFFGVKGVAMQRHAGAELSGDRMVLPMEVGGGGEEDRQVNSWGQDDVWRLQGNRNFMKIGTHRRGAARDGRAESEIGEGKDGRQEK